MKVYKGTDRNMRCKGLQYEIGKTVEVEGKYVSARTEAANEEHCAEDHGTASATRALGTASATGVGCVAVTTGIDGMVMGAVGNAIVCVERGDWDGETYPIKAILAAIVDGETIKADTWYTVVDGEWVEVKD